MEQKNDLYPASFKAAVALAALRGEQSIDELAERYALPASLIQEWGSELEQDAENVFSMQRRHSVGEADFFDSGELARTIAENSTQGFAMMDRNGYCIYANKAWLSMTGYSMEEISSRPLHYLVHHHHPDGTTYPMEECPIDRALPENFDVRAHEDLFFRKDGSTFKVACAASPIFKAGKPVATVIEIRDVTEQKKAEEALRQADRNKDDFIAILAHELRNPLAPIRAAVDLFTMRGTDDPVLKRATGAMARQVAHITRLVDDLLDVARISRGKVELKQETCDVARIVAQTAEDYRPTIEANGVALVVQVPSEQVWVAGDKARIAQVIGNLLHNAAKFTKPGNRILVSLREETDADAKQAVLSVEDDGAGMSAELVETLFNPFIQASQGLGRSNGGLGLGLALVKGLAELHGGTVEAKSRGLELGSTFTVRLPATTHTVKPVPTSQEQFAQAGLRIVAIDDNKDALEMLSLLLDMEGHKLTLAYDGKSGLEAVRKSMPDVVICDIGLPGKMNGYDVAQAIRRDKDLAETVVIAVSGYGQESDRRKSAAAGFNAHLVKPIGYEELANMLKGIRPRA